MERGRSTHAVCERQREADRVPQAWLDRHKRAAWAQQPSSLSKERLELATKCQMVQDQPVEHDVERGVGELEHAGKADVCLVCPILGEHSLHLGGVGVDANEVE